MPTARNALRVYSIARWCQYRHSSALAGTASTAKRHLVIHRDAAESQWPAKFEEGSALLQGLAQLDQTHALADSLRSFACGSGAGDAFIYPDMLKLQGKVEDSQVGIEAIAQFSGSAQVDEIHVYVCTHGSRDCRCGIVGQSFYDALLKEVSNRGASRVKVFQISHIGGHKYAANALVYTSAGVGDWYGSLSAQDASNFVNVVLDADVAKPDDMTSIWWAKWRGRIGLSQEEQVALYENRKALANVSLSAKDSYAAILKAAKAKRLDRKTQKRIDELGEDLIQIKFEKDGKSHNLSGFEGETVKDVAKRAELVDATCGGFLECATCHCQFEPHLETTPISDEEADQLELDVRTQSNSRLACAVTIDKAFIDWQAAGGKVRIPT